MKAMSSSLVFCVLLFFLSVDAGGSEWDQVSSLADLDAPKFKDFLSPIVQVAANAYRYPDLKPVAGWIPAPNVEPLAPSAGAHALVYRKNSSGEALIVAFRGTDLSSRADLCADKVLFNDSLLDTSCDEFSSETLDYFSQAVSYTRKVLDANPGAPLLLTGHSLGAALAILVSAHFSTSGNIIPVVSFSAPPMAKVLERRSLELGAARERKVYAVGDEWDFMMWPASNQVGVLCLYETARPSQCQNCRSIKTNGCFQCFVKTHFMKHVILLVETSVKKPLCKNLSQAKSDCVSVKTL